MDDKDQNSKYVWKAGSATVLLFIFKEIEKLRAKFFRFINDIFPTNTFFYNL